MLTAVPGVLLEDLGTQFAAFSPLSGASHLLNHTSAAVLDLVSERGAGSGLPESAVLAALADEVGGMTPAEIAPLIESHWDTLVAAGLVRRRTV
jgi:PqqD family protein of HPr-rel-A system